MAKITIKQDDIKDCGAACLTSIAAYYNLQISAPSGLYPLHRGFCKRNILIERRIKGKGCF